MKLPGFFRSLDSMWQRSREEHEMDEELRAHIQNRADDLERSGLARAEAERRARLEFGGYEKYKEEVRETAATHFLETLLQDIRYGLRMLRKSPGFTAVAILTLALGIGANTAIFSAVNGILLEPLPYADSSRLVKILSTNHGSLTTFAGVSLPALAGISIPAMEDIRAQCTAFEQIAGYPLFSQVTMQGGDVPDLVTAPTVSTDFFPLLGMKSLFGRMILPADFQSDSRVAVLSYKLWKKDFGGSSETIGRRITLNDRPYAIIGVMPREFNYGIVGDLWIPLPRQMSKNRIARSNYVLARLKNGISLDQANAQLETLAARLAAEYPEEKRWTFVASSVKEDLVKTEREGLFILLGAVGFVLFIACINISALLLSRGWDRQKEVAIREALGATKRRIFRQFLAEGILLALAGGLVGLLISIWAVRVIVLIAPPNTPRIDNLHLSPSVWLFTLGISLATGILFSLAPAMQLSASRVGTSLEKLKGSVAGISGRTPLRLRNILITIEVALAIVLVVGATLLARSLEKLVTIHLGYRVDHVLVARVIVSSDTVWTALDRLRTLPGLDAATISSTSPLEEGTNTMSLDIERNGKAEDVSQGTFHPYYPVPPGYFRTLGIQLLAGRDFNESDTIKGSHVAIVDQAFARQYLSGNPLGQRFSIERDEKGQPQWMEVIGEVNEIRGYDIRQKPEPQFYVPLTRDFSPNFGWILFVRTSENPLAMADAVREQIWAVDKNAPITDMQTMEEVLATRTAEPKFQTILLGSFGVLGLVLAMVGLFGVISYSVAQRTHEIGVRMALGAEPREVLSMVTREGMLLATVGIAMGICGALALSHVLQSFLYEIKPTDPATFVGVAITLGLVAFIACVIPARRAMRVDPMVALRYE